MGSESRERAMNAVQAIFDRYILIANAQPSKFYDYSLMTSLKLIDASEKGTCEYELYLDQQYSNINGVMHGGAAGVIFDMATTTALGPIAKKGFWDFLGGVTRTLNISYLKAVPIGTTVRLRSEVTQAGRTMAMIRGIMTSFDGKTIYCTCEHHKVAVPTQPKHLEYRVPWDDLWDKDVRETEMKKSKL